MAEEEHRESGSSSQFVDPAAISLALGAAANNERVAAKAETFLEEQTRLARDQAVLVRLQAAELHHEDRLRHWSSRVRHVSDVLKLVFELAAAGVVFILVAIIGGAVWNATHDNALVIEAFNVPPDLVARGLTGQAAAASLQDALAQLQTDTESARPADSYVNNWGNAIKVQIPSTGIEIGDAYRLLADWLGHRTYISGEVRETGPGDAIMVIVRAGDSGAVRVNGARSGFDSLMSQAAADIYRRTQPYRFTVYLGEHEHWSESLALTHQLADSAPSLRDRVWARGGGLGIIYGLEGRHAEAAANVRAALAQLPSVPFEDTLGTLEMSLGRGEAVLANAQWAQSHLSEKEKQEGSPLAVALGLATSVLQRDVELGDTLAAEREARAIIASPNFEGTQDEGHGELPVILAQAHDRRAARAAWQDVKEAPYHGEFDGDSGLRVLHALLDLELGDFDGVLAEARGFDAACAHAKPVYSCADDLLRQIRPALAIARAENGAFAEAHRIVDTTPVDCDLCLSARSRIDALQHNWAGAAFWYSRAVKFGPSLPLPETDWGAMLLAKGDTDAAITKFTLAHAKGPHFADPLEMWGEALMLKNRSDLARAKFEEANKYAPNWGRLHLKWGKALLYVGRKDEARKQFAIATRLDLTAADKAVLAREGAMNR